MVDPIESGPAGRVLYWWGLQAALFVGLAVALGLIALGAVLVETSLGAEAEATAYRAAAPCMAVATTGCYLTRQGTITSSDVTRSNNGDRTNLEILLLGRTWSTWVATSWAAEDALQPGRSVMVQLYNDKITLVSVGAFNLTARDNPVRVAGDERLGGLLFVMIGLVFGSVCAVTLWRWHRRPPLWLSLLSPRGLDTATLIGAMARNPGFIKIQRASAPLRDVSRPYTVRPQPSPSTGRSWWMAPLALAFGVPTIALRFRAPWMVLVATLGFGLISAAFLVVLHTMYVRNRRVVVDEITLTRFDMWGRAREVARSEVASIRMPILNSFVAASSEPRVVILDQNSQPLLSLPRYFLSSAQAAELAAAVEASFDPSTRLLSRKAMDRLYPGSLTWYEQHIILASIVLLALVGAAGAGFIWAIDGFTWR